MRVFALLSLVSLFLSSSASPQPRSSPARTARSYTVTVTSKRAVPALSLRNPVGGGYSPCTNTFNPAWLAPHPPGLNRSLLIVRASGCPAAYGGAGDHLMAAYCSPDGICEDLLPSATWSFPYEADAQDPRVFLYPRSAGGDDRFCK